MNTFGTSTNQYPLYDPRSVRSDRIRFRREFVDLLSKANSLCIPTGRDCTKGYILLSRRDYNQLSLYNTDFELHIGDTTNPNNIGILKNLSIVQAQCVTTGLSNSLDALYLVELTDGRGILSNKWFQAPTSRISYNIRAPAYPETFYPNSINTTVTPNTTWTWSTMIESLWSQCSQLGTWPGLPSGVNPQGTPEGFWCIGVPVFDMLCNILDYLGLTIACDLTLDNPFTIVSVGSEDSNFTTLESRYRTNLEDDQEWIDVGAGRVPQTIVVFFKRRNSIYGTEETVRYDSLQWEMTPAYSITINAPSTFSSAVGIHHIWSDFTIRYDMDNNPISADVVQANLIAQERVTQYFDRIYSRTSGYMSRVYAGALPFNTGSQVDSVCWYQTNNKENRYLGWRTRIIRGEGFNVTQSDQSYS